MAQKGIHERRFVAIILLIQKCAGSAMAKSAAMAVWYRIGRFLVVGAAVMITTVTPVWHGSDEAGAADMELGRYLASGCVTCHNAATGTSTIPNIYGLTELHVAAVMKAYRDKALPNPVMQNVASNLSDEEIDALALYFSKTKRP